MPKLFCGIDWSENHHDIALVNRDGHVEAQLRIGDDAGGYRRLADLLAEHGDTPEDPIPVAIETGRGLLVACLHASGRLVFAINPLAASRYRERHTVSRRKSDAGDAIVLANILRTDAHAHRPLPANTELAQAIAVLARAQQDAVWNRQQLANQLRSHLREYYPAALLAFQHQANGGLTRADARAILAIAPTPAHAAKLTRSQPRAALKRSGRTRDFETAIDRIHAVFRADCLRQKPQVEAAMGRQMLALLRQLDTACTAADDLAAETSNQFAEHPDAKILLSFPGLGPLTGARVLAEIGDDRTRFADARAMKAYAGASPVTRASGKSHVVSHRHIKNQRLAHAGFLWALSSLRASSPAKAHYQRRRDHGDGHAQAQRHLFNRFLGQLHHCLQTGELYDEDRAFRPQLALAA
ncbi:IS110 family transposase [Amycolatopsis sp. A1MSW2902]|uniref:IS110 family transposase n=1 Tax=Amycolatopsis sp. A1MSW2902 TaxID=687413 RepID=UPI00307D7BEC